MVFSFLLTPLKRKSRILFFILICVVLWGFVMLSGFMPSAQRAGIMFTMLAMGKVVQRKTNTYNSLAAAALIILMIDPYMIRSVGFQLSFSAVLGIVAGFPLIYKHLQFSHTVPDVLWRMAVVSFCAQVATLPLIAYYFGQVPLLGVLANLVAIPIAMAAVPLGFAVLAFHAVPGLSVILAVVLKALLWLLNQLALYVTNLPFGNLSTAGFMPVHVVLLIVVLVLVGFVGYRHSLLLNRLLAVSMIVFFFSIIHLQYVRSSQHFLLLYTKKNGVADIQYIHGNYSKWLSIYEHQAPNRLMSAVAEHYGLRHVSAPDSTTKFLKELPFGELVVKEGKSFLLVKKAALPDTLPIVPDYLVLSSSAALAWQKVPHIRCGTLVLSKSLPDSVYYNVHRRHANVPVLSELGVLKIPL
jgi:competence protein ComEC